MSTISHHEPERPALYDARRRRFGLLWLDGSIADATFLRSLMIDGVTPDVANSELALLRMEKQGRRR